MTIGDDSMSAYEIRLGDYLIVELEAGAIKPAHVPGILANVAMRALDDRSAYSIRAVPDGVVILAGDELPAGEQPISRPYRPDKQRIDRGDYVRASGLAACPACGMDLFDHPDVRGYPGLHRRCDGSLVKL